MPTQDADKTYSLSQLNTYIQRVLNLNFPESVWIQAELGQVSQSGGHFYLTLIEADKETDAPKAKASAICWKQQWARLPEKVRSQADTIFQAGMQLRLKVAVHFHIRYGLSLHVQDIDTAYTEGMFWQQRQQLLERLLEEGIIEQQKRHQLAPVLQRLAVISSSTAAGLQDFLQRLDQQAHAYKFDCQLFEALMQGDKAAASMIRALRQVTHSTKKFDAVVIIRGGGSQMDLLAFDNEELCRAVAACRLPVLVGVGHEIDRHAVDFVAHTSAITPTALAEMIIAHNLAFEQHMLGQLQSIQTEVSQQLETQQYRIVRTQNLVSHYCQQQLQTVQFAFLQQKVKVDNSLAAFFQHQHNALQQLHDQIQLLDPAQLLERGYSISTLAGRPVHPDHWPEKGDLLETHVYDQVIESKVV